MKQGDNWLLYDGQCPFCSRYVRLVRLRDAVGPVRLVDARNGGEEFATARRAGLDVNVGMVLSFDGRLYHGDACINRLALLSTSSSLFNRLNAVLFRSPRIAALAYPALRTGRNAVLRLMGRRFIDQDAPADASES
jgi:predicted DCC family thiol-disulfide oxidoreductase YuxK